MRKTLFFIFLTLCPLILAQEDEERALVEYSPDFEFRDGLFANFETVKENNAIPPARIVTDEDMFRGYLGVQPQRNPLLLCGFSFSQDQLHG